MFPWSRPWHENLRASDFLRKCSQEVGREDAGQGSPSFSLIPGSSGGRRKPWNLSCQTTSASRGGSWWLSSPPRTGKEGGGGGRAPLHPPRSGCCVCPVWSLLSLGGIAQPLWMWWWFPGRGDGLTFWLLVQPVPLARWRAQGGTWQPRGGAHTYVTTPSYKARVSVIWEGLHSHHEYPMDTGGMLGGAQHGIANTTTTGWERNGGGRKTFYML